MRLVSGDHIETAKAIAEKAGILTRNIDNNYEKYAVMTGNEFESLVGVENNGMVRNIVKFREIMIDLRVLARATPSHKYMIVAGL